MVAGAAKGYVSVLRVVQLVMGVAWLCIRFLACGRDSVIFMSVSSQEKETLINDCEPDTPGLHTTLLFDTGSDF